MVRKQIYIDDHLDSLLKARAELTGETESELVRRALEEVYDPVAARRAREIRWAEYEEGTRRFGELIARAGGIPHLTREERNARRRSE